MAKNFDPYAQHLFGVRLDNVRHACPDCPTLRPRTFCPTCLGEGTVTEATLARWVAAKNAVAK